MKQVLSLFLLLGAVVLISACDSQGRFVEEAGLEKLAKGVSSESDVRMAMGQPDTVWEEEDGSRVLEYPKGPEGVRTWSFSIGTDGKLVDYRQLLTDENFKRVRVGMSKDEVRRMFGRPRTVVQFRMKNEEVWDWRYLPNDRSEPLLFNVHFDRDSGKVTRTSISESSLA